MECWKARVVDGRDDLGAFTPAPATVRGEVQASMDCLMEHPVAREPSSTMGEVSVSDGVSDSMRSHATVFVPASRVQMLPIGGAASSETRGRTSLGMTCINSYLYGADKTAHILGDSHGAFISPSRSHRNEMSSDLSMGRLPTFLSRSTGRFSRGGARHMAPPAKPRYVGLPNVPHTVAHLYVNPLPLLDWGQ
jgi:hypothetical protein